MLAGILLEMALLCLCISYRLSLPVLEEHTIPRCRELADETINTTQSINHSTVRAQEWIGACARGHLVCKVNFKESARAFCREQVYVHVYTGRYEWVGGGRRSRRVFDPSLVPAVRLIRVCARPYTCPHVRRNTEGHSDVCELSLVTTSRREISR